jgi:SAM-dependent methyltransferase
MIATDVVRVDAANVEQFSAWDSNEGVFWAEHAEWFEHSLARYDERLLQAAVIRDGDRVLDLGCGTGSTTRAAARLAGTGSAHGVDLSSPMLAVAERHTEVTNISYAHADAQVYPFAAGSYDAAFSRIGCMFFADPRAAFANVARALRLDGRLALLVWQQAARNEWFSSFRGALAAGRDLSAPPTGAPGPFSMSDPDRVTEILTGAGFAAPAFNGLEEPMYFGPDPAAAERLVLGVMGWLLADLDEEARRRALHDLRISLDAHRTSEGVAYRSAAWLVTTRRLT